MKVDVTKVTTGMCPLNKLAEMGESIRNSWIFLHENAYERLMQSGGAKVSGGDSVNHNKTTCIKWEATDNYPETVVFCEVPEHHGWGKITAITADDIAYSNAPVNPEEIFFLKMAE